MRATALRPPLPFWAERPLADWLDCCEALCVAPLLWPLDAPRLEALRLDALRRFAVCRLDALVLRPLVLRPLVLRPLVLRPLVLRALVPRPLLSACARVLGLPDAFAFRLLDALALRLLDALAFRLAPLRLPDAFDFRGPLLPLPELRLPLDPLVLWLRVLPRLAA
jgi:hypothetical protein